MGGTSCKPIETGPEEVEPFEESTEASIQEIQQIAARSPRSGGPPTRSKLQANAAARQAKRPSERNTRPASSPVVPLEPAELALDEQDCLNSKYRIRVTCRTPPMVLESASQKITISRRSQVGVLKEKLAASVHNWLVNRPAQTEPISFESELSDLMHITPAHYGRLTRCDFELRLDGQELEDCQVLGNVGVYDGTELRVALEWSNLVPRSQLASKSAEYGAWHHGVLKNVKVSHTAPQEIQGCLAHSSVANFAQISYAPESLDSWTQLGSADGKPLYWRTHDWTWDQFCLHVGRNNPAGYRNYVLSKAYWSCCSAGTKGTPCSYRKLEQRIMCSEQDKLVEAKQVEAKQVDPTVAREADSDWTSSRGEDSTEGSYADADWTAEEETMMLELQQKEQCSAAEAKRAIQAAVRKIAAEESVAEESLKRPSGQNFEAIKQVEHLYHDWQQIGTGDKLLNAQGPRVRDPRPALPVNHGESEFEVADQL